METEDYAVRTVRKKKLSPAVLSGMIAGGAVLVVAVTLIVYFAFFRQGSLIDTWHDTDEICEYTFYKDQKVLIDTPYGNLVGTYVFDTKTKEGMISMQGGAIAFSFKDNQVLLENGGILVRGRIKVTHISETTTVVTVSETDPTEETTVVTESTTTVPPETTAVTTAESATPTPEPTPTNTPTPEPTPSTLEPIIPEFSINTDLSFPTMVIVGTPIVGQWDSEVSTWVLEFFEDGTCDLYYNGYLAEHSTYEYNLFFGTGSLIYQDNTYNITVSGDQLELRREGATVSTYYNRVD